MKTKNKIFLAAVAAAVLIASGLIIFLMYSLISARPSEAEGHAKVVQEKTLNLNGGSAPAPVKVEEPAPVPEDSVSVSSAAVAAEEEGESFEQDTVIVEIPDSLKNV